MCKCEGMLYSAFTGVYVHVSITQENGGGSAEPQGSDLCPPGFSLILWPGVRLSALSIISALCGIPRILPCRV